MKKIMDLPVFGPTDLFPMLADEDLAKLADDIKQNGLNEPLVVAEVDGQDLLIDGRNRRAACAIAEVEPATKRLNGQDPAAYVLSANIRRRHMTKGQIAMYWAKAEPEPAALKRKDSGSLKIKDQKVNAGALSQARAVIAEDPKAAEKVLAGDKPLDKAYKAVQKKKKAAKRKKAAAIIPATTPDYQVRLGDVSDLGWVGSESIDCILTDPPYPKKYLPLYDDLGRLAARVLRPGGTCAVMVGQSYLPEIIGRLSEHLTYAWCLAYLTPGGQSAQIWQRKVNTFWKPVLWFTKGKYQGDWLGDVAKSEPNDNDKRFHHWGQSESGVADLLRRLTSAGNTVCDPFVGGGSTAITAVGLGRRFIGSDISQDAIDTTLGRLADV